MADTQDNLDFYRALRSFNFDEPHARAALAYARIFTDLSSRIFAALGAQVAGPLTAPRETAWPAFRAMVESDAGTVGHRFAASADATWDARQSLLLAGMAEWLATGFDASQPLDSSYQVWVGHDGLDSVQLVGPPRQAEPPRQLRLLGDAPVSEMLREHSRLPAAILSHYDVHGLATLAAGLRRLRALGYAEVDCAMSYEWTGEIGKLWKRAVPKTIQHERGYGLLLLLDCSVHSRDPQRTLKAIERLDASPQCHLVLIDHHYDTLLMAPQLHHERLHVVLSDVLSCTLGGPPDQTADELALLGALGDKVPEVAAALEATRRERLGRAVEEFDRRCLYFSPTPPDMKRDGVYPLAPLWEALAEGETVHAELATRTLGHAAEEETSGQPDYDIAGGVLFVTQRLEIRGRTWYGLLEKLLEQEHLSYAIALRLLNGRRVNLLLLTRWTDTHMPPVRLFIPHKYLGHCLGHPGALWADLEPEDAFPFLTAVTAGINRFLDKEAELDRVFTKLRLNILEYEQFEGQRDSI